MRSIAAVLILCSTVFGQNRAAVTQAQTAFVRATGQASVSIKPDQAKIQVSVITQATTAQAASTQNATQAANVLAQLNTVLGPSPNVQTINYTLVPNYSYPQGQPAVLTGYTATNTIQVTTTNLSIVGTIIDTAIGAGANQVLSLQFGLQDDSGPRSQALQAATLQAKSKADAMAASLGLHSTGVLDIQEGIAAPSTVQPVVGTASTITTPIQTGTLTIQASVTLDVAVQ